MRCQWASHGVSGHCMVSVGIPRCQWASRGVSGHRMVSVGVMVWASMHELFQGAMYVYQLATHSDCLTYKYC